MKYNISVIGPTRRQGETTVAGLLALFLSGVLKTRVCLTHTGSDTFSLRSYFGLPLTFDYTRSLSQLVRLLEAGSIAGKEISDYLLAPTDLVDIMETSEPGMSHATSSKLLERSIGYLPHDFVIADINTELSDDITQLMMKRSDLVVVVISQDSDVFYKLNKWRESDIYPEDHKVVYVVNNYDPYVSALRDVSKELGLRHTRVQQLSYSSYIRKMSNKGRLQDIMPFIMQKDSRVLELLYDMKEIIYMITNQLGVAIEWPGVSS